MEHPPVGTVELVLAYRPLLGGVAGDETWLRSALYSPRNRLQIRIVPEGEAALRAALGRRSADELWASRRAWATDSLIVLVVGGTLLWSYVWFVRRLSKARRPVQLRLLAKVLALDALLFVLGVVASEAHLIRVAVLAVLLVPLAAVVEVATFGVAWYRGRIRDPHQTAV